MTATSPPDTTLSGLVVFLSHASEDRSHALALENELAILGADVWFAGHRVPVGGDIEACVREGLRQCHASIVILSREALRSAWVMFEMGATWYAGKTIFPVRLNIGVAELPDSFQKRLTCNWDEREELLIPGLAEIAISVREQSHDVLHLSRTARKLLGGDSADDVLVQVLADCLSPNISERRRAQAVASRQPGPSRDAILAAAELLAFGKDSRVRGEAYYLLGTLRSSRGDLAKDELFFQDALDMDDSLWVQANCAQVLKGMVPLTEATIQRLERLQFHAREAENNEQSELLYRILDTLEAQSRLRKR